MALTTESVAAALDTADGGVRKPGPLDEALAALSEVLTHVENRVDLLFSRFGPVLGESSPMTAEEPDDPPIGTSEVAQLIGNARYRLACVGRHLRSLADRAEF